jgi:hypothetical protein
MQPWFQVDKVGLAKIIERKGKEFVVFELLQNAWDEPGVTRVAVQLESESGTMATLRVIDDAPQGFSNLSHAYTLFAESEKKNNPGQRGRFNLGEKLVLALAKEASIVTTTGTVTFNSDGRRTSMKCRHIGSEITMTLRMNRAEVQEAVEACKRLLPPENIETTVNGTVSVTRQPYRTFEAALLTEIADPQGFLRKVSRTTTVRVFEATSTLRAGIYEMGIPVCDIDGQYVFDVGQKIPLTMDRDEVTLPFRRQLAVVAMNNLHSVIDSNTANTAWAAYAVTSPGITPDALNAYMTQKFGAKRVIYDPSDHEANNRAASEGYTIIHGGSLSGPAWDNVKAMEAALPAGQVTPSPKPYGPNGKLLTFIKPTVEMEAVEAYAKKFAWLAMAVNINVQFADEPKWPFLATYGPTGTLTFNTARLGVDWFANRKSIDDLLIHEFGHQYSADHLSKDYHDALCRLGSELAALIREGKL